MSRGVDIRVDGRLVQAAGVVGLPGVFDVDQFQFEKARWVPDDEATACLKCRHKFSQLRRRHHCRQCGQIFCAKCCNEKVSLAHIGCEEAERVCSSCRHVAELITKSRSASQPLTHLAAEGFVDLLTDTQSLIKVVELGGVQTLVGLSREDDPSTRTKVIKCFSYLTKHPSLHTYLGEAEMVKAIHYVLVRAKEGNEPVFLDGLSALKLFCTSKATKSRAIQDGALKAVLSAFTNQSEAVTSLAVGTLCLLLGDSSTHAAVIGSTYGTLQRLVSLAALSQNEEVKELTLRALCYLSSDNVDIHRHKIIEVNNKLGCCLQKTLQEQPKDPQILINATCLVANLATNVQDQKGLQDLMRELTDLLQSPFTVDNEAVLLNITRGIANFATCKQNGELLCSSLPPLLKSCMENHDVSVRTHALRAVLHILSHTPHRAVPTIVREGSEQLFHHLVVVDGLLDHVQRFLLSTVPSRAKP